MFTTNMRQSEAIPQSFNRYSYVQNDPVNFIDPTGLCPEGQTEMTDPVTGARVCVPNISDSVTVSGRDPFEGMWGWGPIWGGRPGSEIPIMIADPPGIGGTPVVIDPPITEPQQPPSQQETPIWCRPDVIEAMNRAWRRTQNGQSGNEAGFVLNGTPSNYTIVDTRSANTRNEQRMTIYGNTFLLFHVHPNSSTRNPSTPENNARGDRNFGDTLISDRFYQRGRHIPFLVGHRYGLTMYDPRTRQVTVLRENLDWTRPCR